MTREGLVATASMRFMGSAPEETGAVIEELLAKLTPLLGADTSTVWIRTEDGRSLECAERFVGSRDERHELPSVIQLKAFPWLCTRLPQLGTVVIRRPADLPDEAAAERGALQAAGVKSTVWIPLGSPSEFLGMLAVSSARRERRWAKDDVAFLETIGRLVGKAVARQRAAALQTAVYRISAAAGAAAGLTECLSVVHAEVLALMDARNFCVALLDEATGVVTFPFFVDEFDSVPEPRVLGRRPTDWVIRTGLSLLAGPEVFESLVRREEVELVGTPSVDWLGVPLRAEGKTIGALVTQTYQAARRFGEREKHLLEFVSRNIGAVVERQRGLESRRRSEEHYRRLFERNLAGVFVIVPRGSVVDCNDSFARSLGYASRHEVIGRALQDSYVNPGDRALLIRKLEGRVPITDHEMQFRRRDGSVVWILMNAALVPDELGRYPEVIEGTIFDITARKQAEERIEYNAYHDGLTDLPNRKLLYDRLGIALARAHRAGSGLGLMAIDLDRFKRVNDSLGQVRADRVIREVARRLIGCVREGDTVARPGGDEFMVLVADSTERSLPVVARQILEEVARPFDVDADRIFVTASIGAALYPRDGDDAETLVTHASYALDRATALGRNDFELFTADLSAAATERVSVASGLRQALERDEFTLYYQPETSLRDGRIVSMEALLRWERDPESEPLGPARFIVEAEDSGLIVSIGEWVLATACRDAARWRATGHGSVRVAVNLSARQFHGVLLVETIERSLADAGLPPASLELEVTESVAMRDLDLAARTLRSLRARGIRVTLDDFGTGHSSLTYLKFLPADCLKIDRSFVEGVASDPADRAIVTSVIQAAHRLGLETVAEGVETDAQLSTLRALGCDAAQGFLLGRPLPLEGALGVLSAPRGAA